MTKAGTRFYLAGTSEEFMLPCSRKEIRRKVIINRTDESSKAEYDTSICGQPATSKDVLWVM